MLTKATVLTKRRRPLLFSIQSLHCQNFANREACSMSRTAAGNEALQRMRGRVKHVIGKDPYTVTMRADFPDQDLP